MRQPAAAPAPSAQRLLVALLRLAGAIMLLAFPAMLLPVSWMAATHEWLGLGAFPRAPIVDYLARSIAALYGFHGVLLLIVSSDVVRYRAVVRYVAVMNVAFGAAMVAIGLYAGLPWSWVLLEGPPIVAFGGVIAILSRSVPAPATTAPSRARG